MDLAFLRRLKTRFSRMDARDNGNDNPFTNTLCSLEWISCAMDAARRHKQQESDAQAGESNDDSASSHPGDAAQL